MSYAKRFMNWCLPGLVFLAATALASQRVQAGVAITGDVTPSDSNGWTSSITGYVGKDSAGSVTVDSGSTLQSQMAYIGYESTASGTVSITDGSIWSNSYRLHVGHYGNGLLDIQGGTVSSPMYLYVGAGSAGSTTGSGTMNVSGSSAICNCQRLYVGFYATGLLNIENGATLTATSMFPIGFTSSGAGTVTVDDATLTYSSSNNSLCVGNEGTGLLNINNGASVSANATSIVVGAQTGSSGAIAFGGTGGTLTAGDLYVAPSQLSGTGTIVTNGLVSDIALSFDSSHGLSQTLTDFGHVAVTLDLSNSNTAKTLGAGYAGIGTLATSGSTVTCTEAALGQKASSSGTATVDGADSVWTCTRYADIGRSGNGKLKITNGGTLNAASGTRIGCYETGFGVVEVDGNGSTLDTCFTLVGASGYGELNITNGAAVTNSSYARLGDQDGSMGLVTVEGANSTWDINDHLWIGMQGDADMYINDGGSVTTARATLVGNNKGFLGTLNFDGGTLTTQTLGASPSNSYSQVNGTGTINTHGLLSDIDLTIDSTGVKTFTYNDQVTVNLDTSDAGNRGDLGAGYWGSASITIENGAVVHSGAGLIGNNEGSSGTATVTGPDTTWDIAGPLMLGLGYMSNANLTVENGATVVAIGMMGGGGSSNVYFDNGTLKLQAPGDIMQGLGNAYVKVGGITIDTNGNDNSLSQVLSEDSSSPGGGLTKIGDGTLTLNQANAYTGLTTVSGGVLKFGCPNPIGSGDLLINGGTLDLVNYSSTVGAVTLQNGTIQSYYSYYVLTSTSGFEVQSGTVAASLAGSVNLTKTGSGTVLLDAGNYNSNSYTGLTIVQDGVLELSESAQAVVLAGGGADIQGGKMVFDYTTTAPDVQTLLTASFTGGSTAWTTGQFQSFTADPQHGLGWADNGTDQVTVMYTLYGDSNLDGSVNGTDLNAVLSFYNQSGEVWANGDFNYDGSVNGTDLNTVLSNYNQSLSSSTAAVPEPSTLLVMVLGIAGLLAWRKRFGIC